MSRRGNGKFSWARVVMAVLTTGSRSAKPIRGGSTASLDSRNQENFCIRVKFVDQHAALVGDVGGKPALGHLVIEFLFNCGEPLSGNGFRIPFRQSFVSSCADHSKLS